MEACNWYEVEESEGCFLGVCQLTGEETLCNADFVVCECPEMRKDELKSEMIDWQADADREECAGWER